MTTQTQAAPPDAATPRPSRLGILAARIGEAAVEGTIRAAKGVHGWVRDPQTKEAGREALDRSGRALSRGAELARLGIARALPAVGAACERAGIRNSLAKRAEQMRTRYDDYRREREMDELASTLDGLTDRQLEILGFERCYLFTELEARANALDAQEAADIPADDAEDPLTTKPQTDADRNAA